jgi:V/A-type H+-transporting ATPase subunit D
MIAGAIRSRLFELRRDRAAAQRSSELLERKREVLLRELLRRARRQAALRSEAAAATRDARRKQSVARVEMGLPAIESAALAQPPTLALSLTSASVMGVRLPRLEMTSTPFRAFYSVADSKPLDDAGAAFTALLALLARLAEEDASLARLRVALRKVTKLSGALRKIVLPRIEREIREVVEEIEEEERDESVRRGRWANGREQRSDREAWVR